MGKDYLVIMFEIDCDTHLALRSYRQVNVCEFKARQGYTERTCLKKKKQKHKQKKGKKEIGSF